MTKGQQGDLFEHEGRDGRRKRPGKWQPEGQNRPVSDDCKDGKGETPGRVYGRLTEPLDDDEVPF